MAGFGAAAFTVAAGVVTLGGTSSSAVSAVPVPVVRAVLDSSPSPSPDVGSAADAGRGARTARETREAERARIGAAASRAAEQRASTLGGQADAVSTRTVQLQATIKATKAKAAATKAKAEAKKAKAEAKKAKAAVAAKAAEAARQKVIADRGYDPSVTDPREIARQIMKNTYSYGADQYSCFDYIIMRESKWDVHATNASSGAYGIPQALPGTKMATVASDWRTNPATQITWGIDYMKKRYGSPCAAKGFKASHGWY